MENRHLKQLFKIDYPGNPDYFMVEKISGHPPFYFISENGKDCKSVDTASNDLQYIKNYYMRSLTLLQDSKKILSKDNIKVKEIYQECIDAEINFLKELNQIEGIN